MSSSHRELDPKKMLDSESLRINLMLCSLYLSAYEILKSSIIEGVADLLVYLPEPQTLEDLESKGILEVPGFESYHEDSVRSYSALVERYEEALGIGFDQRGWRGFIPSCMWLQGEGVLTHEDVECLRQVRAHRNEVAHELPSLLVSKGAGVNLGHLEQIIRITKKIDPFFARVNTDIAPEIPDEDIMSLGVMILGLIWDAVTEHLQPLDA
jgi:hypothetical protein